MLSLILQRDPFPALHRHPTDWDFFCRAALSGCLSMYNHFYSDFYTLFQKSVNDRVEDKLFYLEIMTHQAKYLDRALKMYEPACSCKCDSKEKI